MTAITQEYLTIQKSENTLMSEPSLLHKMVSNNALKVTSIIKKQYAI